MNDILQALYGAWHDLRRDATTRLFYALYVAVAVATFRHSSYGFATLESGSVILGALSALAIDAGMILSATGLRRTRNWALVTGLAMSAIASVYTQLLFSVSTAASVSIAPGAQWLEGIARGIIDARVLILPALLPVLGVVYAFSAKRPPHTEQDTIEDFAFRVRGETDTVTERAMRIWQAQGNNGYRDLTAQEVADLARCHIVTARKAKAKLKD